MFSSYILYDTVAIEAVYFPRHFTNECADSGGAAATNTTRGPSSAATATVAVRSDGDNECYSLTLRDILLHRLTERYVGRVIPSRGLCVAITEVMEYSASSVRGAAASAWLTVTFGVCVFAPNPGTRLKARIAYQTAAGVYLTMDLFVAIPFLVPAEMLVPGSRFSAAQGFWYLPLDTEDQEGGERSAELGAGPAVAGMGQGSGKDGDGYGSDTLASSALSSTTAAAAAPYNAYMVGAEVIVKVASCTVQSEETVSAAEDADGASGGDSGAIPIMELRGSFVGDALGPMSWFEKDDDA
ncbi:putative DNA-directed RNA polymerase III subunit [Leishmania infantum JPCM5]|uniref:DNA-directed_RNA_polymerase_III_subunit_-__putative n=2 Tax=Leishmania infantum TaxID=5671 RepID=A0A6L0WRE1_LEIIN|nr:putative DNA-directed RNA polymerase III subunit [Leishmania infantum JPCM5]CAC9454996.1 DNA-directed_RNA_polymerase_III_subunit_-__putative [Leishmania infantum]CAM65934.1 putative DNA-directed RNA polymerase III subunit [Leishmania infantum JPCM5]SUZ39564.1 DNA-directed_RNA_polymerase_III_subunit_-__putative [Leishmania infantum]|eukprot:XP_001463569.1 putative DNA-directed RNA polymerase III subunit [Leishmania infantum JPCM5]